jgi:hypothetical protein
MEALREARETVAFLRVPHARQVEAPPVPHSGRDIARW